MKKRSNQLVKSKSWSEIQKIYSKIIDNEFVFMPMFDLVKYIQETGLSKRLFACVSMQKLIVEIYEDLE